MLTALVRLQPNGPMFILFCFLLSNLARGGMQRLIVCVCFIGRLVVIVAPRKYGSIESAFEPEVPIPHNAYTYIYIYIYT